LTGAQFHYVGEFFKNHAYIRKEEDGTLVGSLAKNQFVANLISFREERGFIARRTSDGKFAVADGPLEEWEKRPTRLEFVSAARGTLAAQAWERVNNPKQGAGDRKGKRQEWLFVEITPEGSALYAEAKIKPDAVNQVQFLDLLTVVQVHSTVYLDPGQKKFAPVRACHALW
jgi:hypothetical protein